MTLKKYVKHKISILRQLGVIVTKKESLYMESLPNEIRVDMYAHKLLMDS